MTQRDTSNEGKCNDRNIDSHLELDEFTNIVINGSAPLNRSLNRHEIIIKNNQIRIVFCNITSSSHTHTNVGSLKGFCICNTITTHCYKASSLLNTTNKDKLIFGCSPCNNSDSPLSLLKLILLLEFNSHFFGQWVNDALVRTDLLTELLTC